MEDKMLKQFSFEIRIIIAILAIIVIVGATGLLAYRGMSRIVNAVSDASKPDLKLAIGKSILSNLSDAENSVKIYSITNDEHYLANFYNSVSSIDKNMDELYRYSNRLPEQQSLIDSINKLTTEQ